MHEHNLFLTLTYDDEHLGATPEERSLNYTDIQKFLKRAREKLGPFRYIVAGEYGEKTDRPHFHMAAFGLQMPEDAVQVAKGKRGDPLYQSLTLDKLWRNGFVNIGTVTKQSASYIADYSLKDVNKIDWTTTEAVTEEGEVIDIEGIETSEGFLPRRRPFLRCSTNPPIGVPYIQAYESDCFPQGTVMVENNEVPMCRAYLQWYAKQGKEQSEVVQEILEKRKQEALTVEAVEKRSPRRREARAEVRLAKMSIASGDATGRAASSEQQTRDSLAMAKKWER